MHARALIALTLLFAAVSPALAQSKDEEAGRAAEQAGRYREALTQYTAALQAAAEGSADEQRLREAVLLVARRISPRPAPPEEAERRMARGRAATKAAADEQGYARAAGEFAQALKAAPWLADAYFNLGVVLDKAGRHAEAIRNLKLYLVAAEGTADAKQARDLIYEIEFRQEDAVRAKAESAQKSAQQAQERQRRMHQGLAGTWVHRGTYNTTYYQITPSGSDAVTIRFASDECRLAPGASSCGTLIDSMVVEARLSGNALSGTSTMRWNARFGRCAWRQWEVPASGRVSEDGSTIELKMFPDVNMDACTAGPPTYATTLGRR